MRVDTEAELKPATPRVAPARNWRGLGWGFVVKLVLMALVNAIGITIILSAWSSESWAILIASAAVLVIADVVYFTKRALPLKYILPGLIFLFVFQIFTLGYTAYVAFTNYGTGHAGSMSQAVDAALIQDERRVENSPTFPLAVVRSESGGELGFAITDADGFILVGTQETPLEAIDGGAVSESGVPTQVPGWEVIPRANLFSDQALQNEVIALRVPISDNAEDGSLRTREGSSGAIYTSSMEWDPDAQTLTDTNTGVVYEAKDSGNFVASDGTQLPAGWTVTVGFDNFVRAATDSALAGPLLKVTLWTFAFAFLTVLSAFGLGLLFAIIYNDPRIRARRWMRTLFILPYAFPAFMSALLWRGMFNREFGVVNDWFFFGADINWLGDPFLAKVVVLWVNLWLSYPYWFLVCTGALQALSSEVIEAARIDGASRWRQFRSITLPLLMVSTAPLAIASFAFNFNNFTVIYMLTEGGPPFPGTSGLGSSDILISAIYNISGVSGGVANYGLASALSIAVFVVVGVISAIAFRQTRKLEEI